MTEGEKNMADSYEVLHKQVVALAERAEREFEYCCLFS